MDRVSERLNACAEVVLWMLVALVISVTFAQVVFRYGIESSLSWSEELARYLFVWIIFVGTSVATRRQQHIFVEAFVALLPNSWRRWTSLLSSIVGIVFFSVFAYVGWLLMINAWQQYSTALDIRITWVYAAAPVGAALSIVHLVARLPQLWSGSEAGPPKIIAKGLE